MVKLQMVSEEWPEVLSFLSLTPPHTHDDKSSTNHVLDPNFQFNLPFEVYLKLLPINPVF